MENICKNCKNASTPYDFSGKIVCDCHLNPPTTEGFPMISVDSWCKCFDSEENDNDSSNYLNIKNEDGSYTTIHIPTTIGNMYLTIQELGKEVKRLKEMHPNEHPK